MWTWNVFTKYCEETSSNRRKRNKNTRDVLIKKDRLKQRFTLVLREQWESSLDFFLPSQYVKGSEHISPLDFYRQCWHEQNIIRENWNIISIYRYTFFPKCYVRFLFGNPVQNAMCLLTAQADWEPQRSGQIQLLRGFVHWRQRQSFTSEERWCKAVSCT